MWIMNECFHSGKTTRLVLPTLIGHASYLSFVCLIDKRKNRMNTCKVMRCVLYVNKKTKKNTMTRLKTQEKTCDQYFSKMPLTNQLGFLGYYPITTCYVLKPPNSCYLHSLGCPLKISLHCYYYCCYRWNAHILCKNSVSTIPQGYFCQQMSLATENSITIENLDPSASGLYWCEVSLETPIFTAASPPHQLTVVCE